MKRYKYSEVRRQFGTGEVQGKPIKGTDFHIGDKVHIEKGWGHLYGGYARMANEMGLNRWEEYPFGMDPPENPMNTFKILAHGIHEKSKRVLLGLQSLKTGNQYVVGARGVTKI